MSSEDVVAADSAVATMMKIPPSSVGAVTLAVRKGIGNSHFIPVGDQNYFMEQFPSRKMKDNLRARAAGVYKKLFGES